mmetsp:Transcript_13683/g.18146  ORF Transcript_13683/g.18146 Transcript_13683/m.18146 type:complete len:205 (+) Transcript_13683:654-1268(+)
MVFSCELEIDQCYSDERSHDKQHNEGNEKNPKQRVDLVSPDASEDVVQLNVDGTEGQKSSHEHLRRWLTVPWDVFWDFSGNLGGATGRLQVSCEITSSDSSNNSKRKRYEDIQSSYDHDCVPWKSCSRSATPGNRIHPHENGREWTREDKSCHDCVPDPVVSTELTVETSGRKSSDERCQGIKDDNSCKERSTLGWTEDPCDRA